MKPGGNSTVPRWYGMAARAAMTLVAIVLAVCAANAALFFAEPSLGDLVYDEELGFRIHPYRDKSNQFGFNDADYPLSPAPDVYRILVIGDSFGWMGGRERNYTAILERLFETQFGGHRVDVICAGYSMTHTVEQLALLRNVALAYQPDMVVLGFFTGNDFVDGDPHRRRIAYAGGFIDVDTRQPVRTFAGRPILDRFRLPFMLQQQWTIAHDRWRSLAEKGFTDPWLPSHDAWLTMTGGQMRFYSRRSDVRRTFEPYVDYILRGLTDMRDLLDQHGIDFRVAILPAGFSVHHDRAEQVWRHNGWNPDEFDLAFAQRILHRHLDRQQTRYLDMLDPFRERGRRVRLYLPDDGHWNQMGNDTAARLLFDWLLPDVQQEVDRRRGRDHAPAAPRIQPSRASTAGPSANRS